jgi:hypothetical protein
MLTNAEVTKTTQPSRTCIPELRAITCQEVDVLVEEAERDPMAIALRCLASERERDALSEQLQELAGARGSEIVRRLHS